MFQLNSAKQQNKTRKKDYTNPNTLKSNKNSLDNFERFCEDEYKGPGDEIIRQASQHGKDGILTLLQAWIYWNKERKLKPQTIRSMASPIKARFYEFGISITPQDTKTLDFGVFQKEARGVVTADMIQNLINHADKKRKCIRISIIFFSSFVLLFSTIELKHAL